MQGGLMKGSSLEFFAVSSEQAERRERPFLVFEIPAFLRKPPVKARTKTKK